PAEPGPVNLFRSLRHAAPGYPGAIHSRRKSPLARQRHHAESLEILPGLIERAHFVGGFSDRRGALGGDEKRGNHSAASSSGGKLCPSNFSTSPAASTRFVPGPKIACTPAACSIP